MANFKTLMKNLLTAYGNKHGVLVASWSATDGSSWYRKYSDGWIEQGGRVAKGSTMAASSRWAPVITFPIPFAKTGYTTSIVTDYGAAARDEKMTGSEWAITAKTTTSMGGYVYNRNSTNTNPATIGASWVAYGF